MHTKTGTFLTPVPFFFFFECGLRGHLGAPPASVKTPAADKLFYEEIKVMRVSLWYCDVAGGGKK